MGSAAELTSWHPAEQATEIELSIESGPPSFGVRLLFWGSSASRDSEAVSLLSRGTWEEAPSN